MKVISVFNQKGGVGKTTTVVNLAVALANLSKKVLVVDIDPQANTTSGLGLDKYNIESSLYDLFYANEEVEMVEDNETLEEVDVLSDDETEEENDQVNIEEVNKETYEVEEADSNEEESDHLEEIEEPESIDINEYISQTKSGVDIIPSEAALSGL